MIEDHRRLAEDHGTSAVGFITLVEGGLAVFDSGVLGYALLAQAEAIAAAHHGQLALGLGTAEDRTP